MLHVLHFYHLYHDRIDFVYLCLSYDLMINYHKQNMIIILHITNIFIPVCYFPDLRIDSSILCQPQKRMPSGEMSSSPSMATARTPTR